ncbi:MAG TPA: hypothetical protein RMG48_10695 [Myxococcales bacterium LLY-WYZ-16_1]|nr:hypothetical protein [Myxococcales bacterium LLY-WYZ-16_1]
MQGAPVLTVRGLRNRWVRLNLVGLVASLGACAPGCSDDGLDDRPDGAISDGDATEGSDGGTSFDTDAQPLDAGPISTAISSIEMAPSTICVRYEDGRVRCWGPGAPVLPEDLRLDTLSVGNWLVCGLEGNRAFCFPRFDPTPDETLEFASIDAGYQRDSCGVLTSGEIRCFEPGGPSTLLGPTIPAGRFVDVQITAGWACALALEGTVECFGGESDLRTLEPNGPYTKIAVGRLTGCGMREDGSLHCWGYDDEFGTARPPDGPYSQFDMGSRSACGVREDGTIACWGLIGLTTTPPEGQFKWVAVHHLGVCAVTIDDRVVCWAEEDEELAEIMPPEDLRP